MSQTQNGQSSSSSSSAHNTSSSLSSGGTLSSMETLPTQDVADGDISEEEAKIPVWGRLYPVGKTFRPLDMDETKTEYLFGRDSECDVPYTSAEMSKNMCFLQMSKKHFRIFRERKDKDVFTFIEDLSSNGTFVNGQKIGKGNKRLLVNNDEIALAMPKNKAYIFVNVNAVDEDQETLPAEMKDKYILSKLLGRGACGLVKLAFMKDTCKKVAVKIIETKQFSIGGSTLKDMHDKVMEEVDIIKSLHHPCIIKIEDVFHTDTRLFIVLELVEGGELFDKVVSCGKFPENVAKMLFYQMLVACKYLHDNGITHRDLKPENLLLSADKKEESVIKVTDFGLSKFVGENSLMKTLCGTPTYLAPEILTNAGMGGYTKAVDCWSLGVILFVCLGGYPPFSDEVKVMPLQDQIKRGYYNFPAKWWGAVSENAKDMIKRLLTVDPKRRMTMAQALKHPWMQDQDAIRWAEKLMYPPDSLAMPPSAVPISPTSRRKRPLSAASDDTDSTSSTNSATNCNNAMGTAKKLSKSLFEDEPDDTTRLINNNSS